MFVGCLVGFPNGVVFGVIGAGVGGGAYVHSEYGLYDIVEQQTDSVAKPDSQGSFFPPHGGGPSQSLTHLPLPTSQAT